MFEKLMKYNHTMAVRKINYYKIPCTIFRQTEEGAAEFNGILDEIERINNHLIKIGEYGLYSIVRTPSGGISYKTGNFKPLMWDIRPTNTSVEITLVADYAWRFQFRRDFKEDPGGGIAGNTAFKKTIGYMRKYGIDIEQYAVSPEEGWNIKKTIPSPPIKLARETFKDKEFHNIHHLDLNSSFISGMVDYAPELYKPFNEIYNKRKIDEVCKAVLVETYGYMQSKYVQYRFSMLSKAGVEYNNKMIDKLSEKLIRSGRVPILYNTDGIWYAGDEYHDEDEGYGLGKWKNDIHAIRFRAKSAGAYEYEEIDSKTGEVRYVPVLRGQSKMDSIKPRTEWEWGDIYPASVEIIKFNWNTKTRRLEKDYGKL